MDKAREAVFRILMKSIGNGAYANIALQSLAGPDISRTDRAFATELVYGVLSRKRSLQHVIGQFSSRPVAKLSPRVHVLLLMGAYQVLHMDRVPDSAACNTSVMLAKNHCAPFSGFVNAVLRSLIRGLDSIRWPDLEHDTIQALAIRHSYPDWMAAAWVSQFGVDRATSLMEAGNGRPPLTIRTNLLRNTREELLQRLASDGVKASAGKVSSEAIVLDSPESLTGMDAFREGCFTVQDSSAMLVAEVVDPAPGERVLDMCCAPGGKTTHLAERMGNRGQVDGWDLHENKLGLVASTARRLHIDIINTRQQDATVPVPEAFDQYDRVLVDAPCSGTGIIRRKPDIKWNRTLSDVSALVEIQSRMLYNACRYVKPGGVLVYSTCSLEREENEEVCAHFLSSMSEEGNTVAVEVEKPYRRLYPDDPETDGFFIARFRRLQHNG